MHIGIAGPIATTDIAHLLDGETTALPHGYSGAPLLTTMIEELLSRGHTVSAFTLSCGMQLNPDQVVVAKGANLSIYYCPMRPRAWQFNDGHPGRIIDLYRLERISLQKTITEVGPDVIHAHWAYEFATAALATSIPHVVTCHDSPYAVARLYSTSRPTMSLYRWLRVLLARKVLRDAKFVTAVSPYMRDQVQTITNAKMVVVPNPTPALTNGLARTRHAPASPRLAMVCNGWHALKNPIRGLMAFNLLRKKFPSAELHLFGVDFGLGQIAADWCARKGVGDGMVFHGATPHHKLLQLLAQLDLLLHPSLEESFGMVIAEAMAMGLPVVAGQNSGAVPWVVGGIGGLCDVTQPKAIAKALEETLQPERYVQLSELGIAAMRERFSTAAVVDQFYALYQNAANPILAAPKRADLNEKVAAT